MNQREFIANFNNNPKHRFSFNPDLFERSDDKIIYYLKLIYRSIQRTMGVDSFFTLKVENFEVIEDYNKIRELLSIYLENLINKSTKLKGSIDNKYNFIDLKSTDIKLLVTTLLLEAYDGKELIDCIIAVPRITNKFFFHINNHYIYGMHQLVDASTYNNQTSKAKTPLVTFKCIFPPINVFRNNVSYEDIDGNKIDMITYDIDVFKKSVPACEYLIASMGLYNTLNFLGLSEIIYIGTQPPIPKDEFYIFLPKKSFGIYVAAPKSIFDCNYVVQHVIATLCLEFSKKFADINNMFTKDTWLEVLGKHFSLSSPRMKAISVLTSLESTYDLITKENTRLPEEDKKDVYCIIRWLIYEYSALIRKDNLDVSLKRIRFEEYIAGLIAPKLAKAIYALSDMGEKVNLINIKKRINIPYNYLIDELVKQSIVVFTDTITDNNSFCAIKMSRNGPSAISEKNDNASLPVSYRYLHISSLGLLDDSASGNSAPGISGMLCPLTKIYPGGYFLSEEKFMEPDTWREELLKQIEVVRQNTARKEVAKLKEIISNQTKFEELNIKDFKLDEEQKLYLIETANR